MAGYDNYISLGAINEEAVLKLEEHVDKNRDILHGLHCCSMDIYKTQNVFKFIPGHTAAILDIPNQIRLMRTQPKKTKKAQIQVSRRFTRDANRSAEPISIENWSRYSGYHIRAQHFGRKVQKK